MVIVFRRVVLDFPQWKTLPTEVVLTYMMSNKELIVK